MIDEHLSIADQPPRSLIPTVAQGSNGSVVPEPAPPLPANPIARSPNDAIDAPLRRANYIIRHWRGDLHGQPIGQRRRQPALVLAQRVRDKIDIDQLFVDERLRAHQDRSGAGFGAEPAILSIAVAGSDSGWVVRVIRRSVSSLPP